jgi:phthiocerol/phenolphthiocerol synthesis type-I polyketide synthase E
MSDLVDDNFDKTSIAVVGLAGRFPGANDVAGFWSNLENGVESITTLNDDELRLAGIPEDLLNDPSYVKASSSITAAEMFDAEFFKYSAREAELIDPQHRIFLECAVEALENANCDPQRFDGAVGVFAGAGLSAYLLLVLNEQHATGMDKDALTVNRALAVQGNDKDYLATRVSYKLGLRGPSLSVQTACSTSLVAVHLACQSLISGECDLAIAGGVSVHGSLKKGGYHYAEGGILSPDGHCRPFDAQANGTVFGEGAGIVALKRLKDALAGGDHIHAVIRGSAVNNDGSMKVGYTAPSVDGQASVIAEALAVGGISPETIGYVEAHGTGTRLGDPMEVEALHQVFRGAASRHSCALGSVKSNIGHLNTAAGVAGLIKAVLCIERGEIPASLNFSDPNPAIDFADSPFYVPGALTRWPETRWPRRAGVSSFGIGGTNAHVVIEQAPTQKPDPTKRSCHLALITAKQLTALDQACARLADHLDANCDADIADVCHTLSAGRPLHACGRFAIVRDTRDLAMALTADEATRTVTAVRTESVQPVAFLYPGQGSQQIQMGRFLYAEEPVFREQIDHCADALKPHLRLDLRALLFSEHDGESGALLRNTEYAQPAIFAVSYAMAQLWASLGVSPKAALGHSIGEFVAACLAGVFSLDDGLRITAVRGRLMQSLPAGAMLAVAAPAHRVASFLSECTIAADNGPEACVASGPAGEIEALQRLFATKDIAATLLQTSHAFHSPMMRAAVTPFTDFMASIDLRAPQSPYISNVTGGWITAAQATDPVYWGRHLVETVQFHKGLRAVLDQASSVLVEVGPGSALARLARAIVDDSPTTLIKSSLPYAGNAEREIGDWLSTAAGLWHAGVPVDWSRRYTGERRQKLQLPNYQFKRQRYWIDSGRAAVAGEQDQAASAPSDSLLHTVTWKRIDRLVPSGAQSDDVGRWLVFSCGRRLERAFVDVLRDRGQTTVVVDRAAHKRFRHVRDGHFVLNPARETDFQRLFAAMGTQWLRGGPLKVVYFCNAGRSGAGTSVRDRYYDEIGDKIHALVLIMRSLARYGMMDAISLTIVTRGLRDVIGGERTDPMAALTLGPCLAAKYEYPGLETRIVDVSDNATETDYLAQALAVDLASPPAEVVTVYRRNRRWVPMLEPIPTRVISPGAIALRTGGTYFITGGLGEIGLAIAKSLAQDYQARLVLIGRTCVPDRSLWDGILSDSAADERLAAIIRGIREIEASGGEVMIGRADVTDPQQMRIVVRQADARFARLHGVVHAAGVPGSTPIGIKTLEQLDQVLRPKILGLANLEQLFAKRDLDFLLTFSSISALQGRAGQVDYIGANAYLDSCALQPRDTTRWPMITINWDTWREIGMAVNGAAVSARRDTGAKAPINGLSTAEGIQAFFDSLAIGIPQIVVMKRPSAAVGRRQADREADKKSIRSEPAAAQPKTHPRPALPTPYVAPETELESVVSEMWVDVLKTKPIGINDNFFELGGHSLLALQLLPRIRDRFQITLEPRELFTEPTVAGVVAIVENKMIAEIEEMS